MMALYPDLVDLSRIEDPYGSWPLDLKGENPRLSTAGYGEYLIETTVEAVGRKVLELGL
jgi:creatinine amidohydrolase